MVSHTDTQRHWENIPLLSRFDSTISDNLRYRPYRLTPTLFETYDDFIGPPDLIYQDVGVVYPVHYINVALSTYISG